MKKLGHCAPWAWAKRDDEILRQYYPTHPATEVAEMLGKTESSVRDRAKKLGVVKITGSHTPDVVARRTASNLARNALLRRTRAAKDYPSWPKVETNELAALSGRRYDDAPASLRSLLGDGKPVMITRRAPYRYQGSGCGNSSMMCVP